MSTNYYVLTKDKSLLDKYGLTYELTDTPDWGYKIHICQTAFGVVPLYQAHKGIRTLQEMKTFLSEPNIQILDEYKKEYTTDWMLNNIFNKNIHTDLELHSRNEFSYSQPLYTTTFFKDEDDNEFCIGEFT